jgi:hypothetical protein
MSAHDPPTTSPAASLVSGPARARPRPLVRVDAIGLSLTRGVAGVSLELRPLRAVTAAAPVVLPAFDGWLPSAELVVELEGLAERPASLALELGGAPVGAPVRLAGSLDAGPEPFRARLVVPLRAVRAQLGAEQSLGLVCALDMPGATARRLTLTALTLAPLDGPGPELSHVELSDVTDALLVDAPERRLFDLQNPEEGFWRGSGKAHLALTLGWAGHEGPGYALELELARLSHALVSRGDESDALYEQRDRRRAEGGKTHAELTFDTGHEALEPVPDEGRDVPLDLVGEHVLGFELRAAEGKRAARALVTWRAALPLRLRDPRPLLKTFQRLSAVGIDFGTSATVAALYQKGHRSLLQLGRPEGDRELVRAAENPATLLIEDHERLFAELSRGERFPDLARAVRGSHAALAAQAEAPTAVVGELKTLPERVLTLDHAPQLRDRQRQRDFLLDEARVRALIRCYAYLLGRAINRPGQDVYLRYVLTHPAKVEERIKRLLEDEIRAGILASLPTGIAATELSVAMMASEPEAFAAEVGPELASHPAVAPLVEAHGELRFVVLDLGGGTLDIACGRFRPATPEEESEHGASTVIETLQVNGDDQQGGEIWTHELVWLAHQHPRHLPEMEEKEVPMMRPPTVPAHHLAKKPQLYKRSLAARQNKVRFERELELEQVKFGPGHAPRPVASLSASRLDGTTATLGSYSDVSELGPALREHLEARLREAAKLLSSTLASAPWPASPSGEKGGVVGRDVVLLLAGNSSRSEYVSQIVAEELGLVSGGARLVPFRPEEGGDGAWNGVVCWDTKSRTERGVTIVGVTPKTAVALGALRIASHEVHLVRRSQGFGYFLGDLRGFPPKFTALVPMGAPSGSPDVPGPHVFEIGRWDSKLPLRVAREYVPGQMTSSDPRISLVPTGLPAGHVGKLHVIVTSPDEVTLALELGEGEPLVSTLNLSVYLR